MAESASYFIECSLCMDPFDDPRALPCLHTFCFKCLKQLLDQDKIKCPKCRKEYDFTADTVETLPKNFMVNSFAGLVEDWESLSSSPCSTKECKHFASHVCLHGCQYLCHGCASTHKRSPLTKGHRVDKLEVEEENSEEVVSNVNQCFQHVQQSLTIYCELCQATICSVCLEDNHKGHTWTNIQQKITDTQQMLEKIVIQAENSVEIIDQEVQVAHSHNTACMTDVVKTKERITSLTKELHELINQREEHLLQDLSIARNKFTECAREMKTQQETIKTSFVEISDVAKNLGNTKGDVGIIRQAKLLLYKLQALQRRKVPVCNWVTEDSTDTSLAIIPQSIQIGAIDTLCSVDEDLVKLLGTDDNSERALKTIPIPPQSSVCGLAAVNDSVCLASYNSSQLRFYYADGRLKQNMTVDGLDSPICIAAIQIDPLIIIIGTTRKQMYWLTLNSPCNIISQSKTELDFLPINGFTVMDTSDVYCCDRTTGKIHIFNSKGVKQKSIQLSGEINVDAVLPALDNIKGNFVLLDRSARKLIWLNAEGQVGEKKRTCSAC